MNKTGIRIQKLFISLLKSFFQVIILIPYAACQKQKGYKKVECPNEQKESKDYKDMMKAIEEYKKEMKSNERK